MGGTEGNRPSGQAKTPKPKNITKPINGSIKQCHSAQVKPPCATPSLSKGIASHTNKIASHANKIALNAKKRPGASLQAFPMNPKIKELIPHQGDKIHLTAFDIFI